MLAAPRCEIVLFHSALGLRPAVLDWARWLRDAGYVVHTPDLYAGCVFDDVADGLRHVETIGGIPALIARSQAAVAELPNALVYAGFSNGAASAELLAATRPGARGAVLMHGLLPIEAFGASEWPATVPVQSHSMLNDPFRDQVHVDASLATARRSGARVDHFDYAGAAHLFSDSGLPEFDPSATAAMRAHVLDFLAGTAAYPARDA